MEKEGRMTNNKKKTKQNKTAEADPQIKKLTEKNFKIVMINLFKK